MENCKKINFEIKHGPLGSLVAIENIQNIPFEIERIYYIFDVEKGVRRGFHAHRNLEQVLICLSGSVKILAKTPNAETVYELSRPNEGLFIGKMIWREMYDFSPGSVLLVLASKYYTEDDYIRSYDVYEREYVLRKESL